MGTREEEGQRGGMMEGKNNGGEGQRKERNEGRGGTRKGGRIGGAEDQG
jgi:hypothetical protein